MKIVFLEPLGISENFLAQKVEGHIGQSHDIVYYKDRVEDTATLIERSRDADIVVLSNFKFNRKVMENCPNLKMICVAFTGVDHIDLDYCNARGITVCNCAGYSTNAVSELVFAMAINLARDIFNNQKRCKEGLSRGSFPGFELSKKTFGIIGLGAIGTQVANIAKSFGSSVLAYNRSPKEIDGVTLVSLKTLLKTSDIVSIHLPQTSETRGLIGENELSMMKSTAILINTARGPIVDNKALFDALTNGTIACAGIDVFDSEPPLSENEILLKAPNTLLTPHIAFSSEQAFEKRADIIAKNLSMWLDENPQNVVNEL